MIATGNQDEKQALPETYFASAQRARPGKGDRRDRSYLFLFVAGLLSGACAMFAAQLATPAAGIEHAAIVSEAVVELESTDTVINLKARERIFRVVNAVELEIRASKEELESALLNERELDVQMARGKDPQDWGRSAE